MAFARTNAIIYIADAGTDPADLKSTDMIEGEISNFTKSGGERDVESVPVFGGFVDLEKPVGQVELQFDLIVDEDNQTRWEAFSYAKDVANTGVYTMASETSTQATDKAVFIAYEKGTKKLAYCFNNCSVTMLDMEHSADDNLKATFNLKFSPTTSTGVSNYASAASDITDMPDWTALDNN